MSRGSWWLAFIALVLCAANVAVWSVVWPASRQRFLTVAFLDVGQGDAVFIQSPTGNQVLLDGGPGKAVLRELASVMPWFDRSIDLIIGSHPDADHIGGLLDVLERYQVSGFMDPGVESDNGLDEALATLVSREPAERLLARSGQRIHLGGGAVLTVLFPDRDPAGLETNDASVVARLVYGNTEFLLTGDSPKKIEQYLIGQHKNNLEADVLKVGHHGSRTSTSPELLYWVRPSYAVISVGSDNRYGHPHAEVLDNLKNASSTVVRTDEQGTIVFKTDGENLQIQ